MRALVALALVTSVIALAGCEPVLLGRPRRAAPSICSATCELDAECAGSGAPGARCVGGWCAVPADRDRCEEDLECGLARTLCASDADCADGEACVDPGGGRGRCGFVPDDGVDCTEFGAELQALPAMQGGATIEVCIDLGAACRQGSCAEPCAADTECTRVGALHCDAIRGECGCATDADCIGPGSPRCAEGRCVVPDAPCP